MNEKLKKIFANCVKIAVEQDYASDFIEFDLNGDWELFEKGFEEFFNEPLYNNYEKEENDDE